MSSFRLSRRVLAWALALHAASGSIHPSAGHRPISDVSSIHQRVDVRRRCLTCTAIHRLRGGQYETNPNYQGGPTLGDVDQEGSYRVSSPLPRRNDRPPPITQLLRNYFIELRRYSPILCDGTIASLLLFVAWQRPNNILLDHFVTSHYNVVRRKRFHALFLSAISHADFRHLALNLYAFLTFGRSVRETLARQGVPLWAFVFPAAVFGNLAFLAFDGGHGSCIGLSGVTLALLAFDALVHPSKELRLFVAFFPITLPAFYLLLGLVSFSILGILGIAGRSNVAHSTHLGGLAFGGLFYEAAYKRGYARQCSARARKAYTALRGG
ncbi:hypothetical protein ACHAXT_008413 [Thalassiosira profunda]